MGWILSGREDRDDKKSKKTANTQNPLKKIMMALGYLQEGRRRRFLILSIQTKSFGDSVYQVGEGNAGISGKSTINKRYKLSSAW